MKFLFKGSADVPNSTQDASHFFNCTSFSFFLSCGERVQRNQGQKDSTYQKTHLPNEMTIK